MFVDAIEVVDFGFAMGGWQGSNDWATQEENLAFPDGPNHLSSSLSGFGMSGYSDNNQYSVPLTLTQGAHTFHAKDQWGDGWEGGFWEILDSTGAAIVGGPTAEADGGGIVQGEGMDVDFTVPGRRGATSSFTVRIHTGDWGSEVSWSIDDGEVIVPASCTNRGDTTSQEACESAGNEFQPESTSGYAGGGGSSEIKIGGNGRSGFQGHIGAVSILSSPTDHRGARCYNEYNANYLGTCSNVNSRWRSNWLVLDDVMKDEAALHGDAFLHGDFGLTLDGSGDYMTVPGDAVSAYAQTGEFGISMWFTRRECVAESSFEIVYAHYLQSEDSPGGGDGGIFWTWQNNFEESSIYIMVGCAQGANFPMQSTLSGDIVRTILVDDSTPRKKVSFDWGLNTVSDEGGANREWVHMVLSVQTNEVSVFADGLAVENYGYGLADPDDVAGLGFPEAWYTSPTENVAYTGRAAFTTATTGRLLLSAPLSGFGVSGFANNDDYRVELDMEAGDHIFHAVDEFGDGWQGGWFEVSECTGNRWSPCGSLTLLAGGETEGQVHGDSTHVSFRLEQDTTVQIHLRTALWASEYSWSMDAGGRGMHGPTERHIISVGGQAPGWGGFTGEINALSLHRSPPDQHDVTCLYDYGASKVNECPDFSSQWRNKWIVFNGTLSEHAALQGDTTIDDDPSFGVNFDGEYDSIKVGGDEVASYALDGSFSISLWFTRAECDISGRYEELFRQQQIDGWSGRRDGSSISITIGCARAGVHSTIDGDVIRVNLRDEDGNRAAFDLSVAEEASNGNYNAQWAHLVLSVDTTSVNAFIDGMPVNHYGFQTDSRGGEAWQTNAEENLAYPDPGTLNSEFGRFPVGSVYEDEHDYYVPVSLAPGTHTFHAVDTYGDSWQGGWFEIYDSHLDTIVGGEESGVVPGAGQDFEFSVRGADASDTSMQALTVRIKTGRWASEYQWSVDAGSNLLEDGTADNTGGYSGPAPAHAVTIGDGGRTGFYGSINMLSLHRSALSASDATCLNEFGKLWVATCPDPSNSWTTSWLIGDELPEEAEMHGDAVFDSKFGIELDGEGDYVTIVDHSSFASGGGGSFSGWGVSLWFTRKACADDPSGNFEMIFSQQADDSGYWNEAGSHIHIGVGCAAETDHSTLGGAIIRTELITVTGQRVNFDVRLPTTVNGNGYLSQWVHYVLSVDVGGIHTFLDGVETTEFGFKTTTDTWAWDSGENWYQTATNLAWPDPTSLNAALDGFALEGYADNEDITVEVELSAGLHVFHATDKAEDGWEGGYFTMSCPEWTVGGSELGIVAGVSLRPRFLLALRLSLCCCSPCPFGLSK